MASEKFIDRILQEPSYKWANERGELVVPTTKQLWSEFFKRINLFKDKRNWMSAMTVIMVLCAMPIIVLFFTKYFTWYFALLMPVYAMMVMGTHGTIWFHRYCTHKSYVFKNAFWRIFTQNLVIKCFPEEVYVISHHVHHVKSDEPGDPYNPQGGLGYCMLSVENHQGLNKNLTESEYERVSHFMKNSGIERNTYAQFKKRGSIATPRYTILVWLLNWSFWYTAFFLIGGHGLATAMFTAAMIWYIGVRAFNYSGHGGGHVKHVDGIDFDRSNLSINQNRPGMLAGEWHNNHHLYPGSARAGFLKYQIDFAWIYIYVMHKLGAVKSFKCSKKEFMKKYMPTHSTADMVPLSGEPYIREQIPIAKTRA